MAEDLHLPAQPLELLTLLGGELIPFTPADLGLLPSFSGSRLRPQAP